MSKLSSCVASLSAWCLLGTSTPILGQEGGAVRVLNHATVVERGFSGTRMPTDGYGSAVARLGDVDGDGIADLGIGAYRANESSQNNPDGGRVTILFLCSDGTVRSHLHINRPGWFGLEGLVSLGDIDGNGFADIAVGAPVAPNTNGYRGRVSIFRFSVGGAFVETQITAPNGADLLGRGLAWRTAPGGGDLWVGAPGGGSGDVLKYRLDTAGAVVGSPQSLIANLGFSGALLPGDGFGSDLELVDRNNDGAPDLLVVGASGDDTGGLNAGALWVCQLGANGQVTAQTKISQQSPGFRYRLEGPASLGGGVAVLGDVDGDGNIEVCASAAFWTVAGDSASGVVYCMELDNAANIVSTCKIHQGDRGDIMYPGWGGVAYQSLGTFGYDVAAIGDTDRDGRPELMVGAVGSAGGGTAVLLNLGTEPLAAPPGTRTPAAAPLECGARPPTGRDQSTVRRFSGEFVNTRVDVNIPGRGTPFLVQRTTRTRAPSTGNGGNNASHALAARVRVNGNDLIVGDGMGDEDRFTRQSDGSWTAPGVFRRITRATDAGEYTLIFENTARWEFHPTDGSPVAGKLRAIHDRNGNSVTLLHDVQGQLVRVTDAVGRDATFTYDAAGRTTSVRDCAGRDVTYAYYQSAEAGGTEGDLKSVTTPAVTGTPHGNDFPNGKTTTYTYTRGFADPVLNSDLLTITDPRGKCR